MALLGSSRIIQNSWVVTDIEAAIDQWVEIAGVGPFFEVDLTLTEDQLYHGMPTMLRARVVLAQAGDVQVELVLPEGDGPSVYRDLVPEGQSGFHHVAMVAKDYDREVADLEAAGFPVAFSGSRNGKRFCYVDTSPALACMVELLEYCPRRQIFFDRVAEAARGWDGKVRLHGKNG